MTHRALQAALVICVLSTLFGCAGNGANLAPVAQRASPSRFDVDAGPLPTTGPLSPSLMAGKPSGSSPPQSGARHTMSETWNWNLISANVSQVALAPDGTIWAVAAGPAGTNRSIWHYSGGGWQNISALGSQIAIAPDGTLWDLVANGNVWDYVKGLWTNTYGNVSSITVDRNGNVWATAAGAPNGQVWEYTNGAWGPTGYSGAHLASNPDNSLYVLLANGDIWNAPSTHCQGTGGVDITPKSGGTGFYVLSGAFNGSYQIWDYTDATPGNCSGGSYNATGYYASSVSFLGNTLAVVANGNVYTAITNMSSCAVPAGTGYYPCDLQSAYNLPSATGGLGQTIGIVDAFDDPNAEADLAVYRSHFGLPSCTTANGCFRKTSQTGTTTYPAADSGWASEISLDLDMASAICPNCHIVLVEATTNGSSNLGTAVNEAATLGATEISGSYGGSEGAGETTLDSSYYGIHPGIPIVISAGDDGFGAAYPATSPYVVAVGGTALAPSSSLRGWSETAWGFTPNGFGGAFSGTGSGCSAYEPKPNWQMDWGCTTRMEADVSAVADGNTGLAVYNTYLSSGWGIVGGTSAAAPIIAGVFALGGGSVGTYPGQYIYSHSSQLWNITNGTNGPCPGVPQYFCFAGPGYNGPTGLGTPDGLGAFGGASIASVNRMPASASEVRRLQQSYVATPKLVRACPVAPPGYVACYALIRINDTSRQLPTEPRKPE